MNVRFSERRLVTRTLGAGLTLVPLLAGAQGEGSIEGLVLEDGGQCTLGEDD
jgi:hypothetical protein